MFLIGNVMYKFASADALFSWWIHFLTIRFHINVYATVPISVNTG